MPGFQRRWNEMERWKAIYRKEQKEHDQTFVGKLEKTRWRIDWDISFLHIIIWVLLLAIITLTFNKIGVL